MSYRISDFIHHQPHCFLIISMCMLQTIKESIKMCYNSMIFNSHSAFRQLLSPDVPGYRNLYCIWNNACSSVVRQKVHSGVFRSPRRLNHNTRKEEHPSKCAPHSVPVLYTIKRFSRPHSLIFLCDTLSGIQKGMFPCVLYTHNHVQQKHHNCFNNQQLAAQKRLDIFGPQLQP